MRRFLIGLGALVLVLLVGSVIFLSGVGLLGRSAVALLLAALACTAALVWIPIEERILERRFGRQYELYRERVPRFLGIALSSRSESCVERSTQRACLYRYSRLVVVLFPALTG